MSLSLVRRYENFVNALPKRGLNNMQKKKTHFQDVNI